MMEAEERPHHLLTRLGTDRREHDASGIIAAGAVMFAPQQN